MFSHLFNWLEQLLIGFSRAVSYVFYLMPFQLWTFRKKYPYAKVIVSGVTKARKMETNSPVQYELGWVASRRGILVLTETQLICSDWVISLEMISDAMLLDLTGGYVLKVSTLAGEHYQFGLNKNLAWATQSVLPLVTQKGSIQYSIQSLVLRAIGVVGLIWYLYQGISTANLALTILMLVAIALIGIPLIMRILQRINQNS